MGVGGFWVGGRTDSRPSRVHGELQVAALQEALHGGDVRGDGGGGGPYLG